MVKLVSNHIDLDIVWGEIAKQLGTELKDGMLTVPCFASPILCWAAPWNFELAMKRWWTIPLIVPMYISPVIASTGAP